MTRIDHLRLVVPARDAESAERLARAVAEELRRTSPGAVARGRRASVTVELLDGGRTDRALAAEAVRAVWGQLQAPPTAPVRGMPWR